MLDFGQSPSGGRFAARRAFTLVELIVVIGIISLLLSIILPSLQVARKQANGAMCAVHLQQLGRALLDAHTTENFFPYWDDDGAPVRFTWIDVLVQNRYLQVSTGRYNQSLVDARIRGPVDNPVRVGYCPEDPLPDPLNRDRHANLIYPRTGTYGGVDYSYGIGAPLSAGGWALSGSGVEGRKRFREYQRNTDGRVLAGDAISSRIYNLSGYAIESGIWNDPTQYDNTVAWSRHSSAGSLGGRANILFQDGHLAAISYNPTDEDSPINTSRTFVWQLGERFDVRPGEMIGASMYPDQSPNGFPRALFPRWITDNGGWTLIPHK